MNVSQLKKLLENVPNDTLIVAPSKDHSYRQVSFNLTNIVAENYKTHPRSGNTPQVTWDNLSEHYSGHDIGTKDFVLSALVID